MIVPAIIPETKKDLFKKINYVKDSVDVVHIDICDGKYVPSVNWPIKFDWNDVEGLETGEEELPGWDKLDFEVDLMTAKPLEALDHFVKIGISSAIIHAENLKEDFEEILKIAHEYDVMLGLALLPGTNINEYKDWVLKVDFVQCMGISKIGYQGQDFDERIFDQIEKVKEIRPDVEIVIDGHVDEYNIQDLASMGVSKFVIGSAIFNSTSIPQKISELKQLVQEV